MNRGSYSNPWENQGPGLKLLIVLDLIKIIFKFILYYQFLIQQSCLSTCGTCTNSTSCLTCNGTDSAYRDPSLLCACNATSFNNSLGVCTPCSFPCASCSGSATTCSTCVGTNRNPAPGCTCSGAFYDDGTSANCVKKLILFLCFTIVT